jgi:hypothetical protein
MYIDNLSIYGFKCFGRAILKLRYPGEGRADLSPDNVNLILGDNGGGKSSVLKAIAIAVLAPVLLESGFVPYRLVRRPDGDKAFVKVIGRPQESDSTQYGELPESLALMARLERRTSGDLDRLHTEKTPDSPIESLIFDDYSPAFFMVGYGATRRVETGDYSESSSRRARGLRYRRVAGLFEDHVPLRPFESWLPGVSARHAEIAELLGRVLPPSVRVIVESMATDIDEMFEFNGVPTPFPALSDGYKAFIGWISDLLGHLADVCPDDHALTDVSGIVLVDEIDLHLHPEWQRGVVHNLAQTFPRLQFVMTTHSPLVASSVQKEHIFLTMEGDDGYPSVGQIEESVFGRSIEQLLLSSYFGLETTKPESFERASDVLMREIVSGSKDAALTLLDQLSKPPEELDEMSGRFAAAKRIAASRDRT